MGLRLSILSALILCPVAFAQSTPSDAAARLKARDAERQAAASRPATLTQAEVDALRQQVRALQAQLRDAQQQIASMRGRPAPTTGRATPGNAYSAAAGTERLAKYLDAHPDLPPAIRGSMLSGVPRVGMTEEQLRAFGYLKEKAESTDGKVFVFTADGATGYRITTDADGKVIAVEQ